MRKYIHILFAVFTGIFLLSCVAPNKPPYFTKPAADFSPKLKAVIAVIPASDNKIEEYLAKKISEGLEIKGVYNVFSVDEAKGLLGDFYAGIPAESLYRNTPDEDVIVKFDLVKKKIRADYIYIVSVNTSLVKVFNGLTSNTYVKININAIMVEYPERRIVARTSYDQSQAKGLFQKAENAFRHNVNEAGKFLVFKITKRLGYKK